MIYWLTYFIVKPFLFILASPKIIGRENVPRKGGFILASNHQSNVDPFLLGTFSGRALNFMAKDSLFRTKLLSWLFSQWGAFPIKRESSDFKGIRETIRRLNHGTPILMFPEGTRGKSTLEKKARDGIGFLAARTGVPVIPVYIKDSDKVLVPGSKKINRFQVTIIFGPAMFFSKDESYDVIAKEIVGRMYSLSP